MSAEPRSKDPRFVAAGRATARKRWGEKRRLRIDELDDEDRRLTHAIVAAVKATRAEQGRLREPSDD